MAEEVSELARWAHVYREDARERSVKARDKFRFVAFCTEQAAVDVQLIADELQLTKTVVVSRLVSIAARDVCRSLGLVVSGTPPEMSEQDIATAIEYGDMDLSRRRAEAAAALRSRGLDVEEVPE